MIDNDRLKHIFEVAKLMKNKAEMVGLDNEEMFTLGMLHDIGYEFGENNDHNFVGFEILDKQNYKYAKEVLYHGKPNSEYQSLALDLLNFADMHIDKSGEYVSYEQRLEDIKIKERQSLNQALSMLYMQYKNEQIDHDQYINYKNDIENKISHLDSVILTLSQTINNNVADTHNNFVSTFKKYKTFTSLTREMALELIKKIKVYEDKRIEVELNFQDEFEIAIKYLESELR